MPNVNDWPDWRNNEESPHRKIQVFFIVHHPRLLCLQEFLILLSIRL
jgi:hypothetical protein